MEWERTTPAIMMLKMNVYFIVVTGSIINVTLLVTLFYRVLKKIHFKKKTLFSKVITVNFTIHFSANSANWLAPF